MMLLPAALLAGGFSLKDGRFSDGPVVILKLSRAQAKQLDAGERLLELSGGQRKRLKKQAGGWPRQLRIYDTRKGETDCPCHAHDVGLRFDARKIEVPQKYLTPGAPPDDVLKDPPSSPEALDDR